jgi:antitoxin component YwqK of YwqJK toxin-antitoxin module
MSEHAFGVCCPIIVSFINEDEFALGLGRVNKLLSNKKKYCTNIQPHGDETATPGGRTVVSSYRQGRLRKVTYYFDFSRRISFIDEFTSNATTTYRHMTTYYHHANGSVSSTRRLGIDGKCEGLQEQWHSNGNRSFTCYHSSKTGGAYTGEHTHWYVNGKIQSIDRYGDKNGTYGKFVGRQERWHGNGQIRSVRIYGTTPEEAGVMKESVEYNAIGEITRRILPADGSASSIII